jgi:predicted enzyme related to lactoylglutathione lyase
MAKQICWFEVLAADATKAQRFYSELFDWKIDTNNPMKYGMIDTGSKSGVGGGIGTAQPNMYKGVTFYVEVDDLMGTLKRAEKLGGAIVLPPMDVPNGPSIALFRDPEGNTIGLAKMVKK